MKKYKKTDKIPEGFNSLEEASDFWDENSIADHWDETREIDFEVDVKKEPRYVALERELSEKVAAISRQRGISTETLVNLWIKEKIAAK